MSKFKLGVWTTRDFPKTWTHLMKGSFADPQSATQGATDLFCYDQNAGIGAFFATVKEGRLNDGTLVQDGPRQVGPNHSFDRRWTHIVTVPLASIPQPFPDPPKPGGTILLFHDAASGVGEFYATDGRGGLSLKKRQSGWRTSWTQILAGRFGKANLLFYDAADGTGEFYSVDESGGMRLTKTYTGWRGSWRTILKGNFSSSPNDDLLFYDKGAGVGEFYKINNKTVMTQLKLHDNWRTTWQQVVPGQFLQSAAFDGLLFYEEGGGFSEAYATDGHGGISQVDIDFGDAWRLPWHTILAGEFTPNIGLTGTSRFCTYDAVDGALRYFFLEPAAVDTVLDLNGRWTDGSTRSAVISTAFTSLTVDMSAYHRPAAHGSIVDPSTITVTFPDDATYTGTLQPPNTIRWSNRSAWAKL